MKRRTLVLALSASLGLALAGPAAAEDLVQIYREAQQNDPAIAAARANWNATQERLPQARAGLLPNVGLSASANVNDGRVSVNTDPRSVTANTFNNYGYTVSATQPIFRYQNLVAYDQAKTQVEQADYTLALAQQDLIIRVAVAYFDVLLAQFNIELVDAQKAAVGEQLAQAKRNFEVGVATITDTNEAQAKYDQIVATEISTRNDYDNRVTALRAIIGRTPNALNRLSANFDPPMPEPNVADYWVDLALKNNLSVRVNESNYNIATLQVDRERAGHYPTLDLVGSFGNNGGNGSAANDFNVSGRSAAIGLAVNLPIYQGGFVNSKVREAIALQDTARQNLEGARRSALFNAQTGFTGVTSSVASVKAFGQAVKSADVAYQSNKLGLEVGVRTTLDVLNTQQNVYTARRDLAQAYFNYLIGVLRLKSAIGTLNEQDVEELNRRLAAG
jgi:outer membrane protein